MGWYAVPMPPSTTWVAHKTFYNCSTPSGKGLAASWSAIGNFVQPFLDRFYPWPFYLFVLYYFIF
jgi:hypothetical protein